MVLPCETVDSKAKAKADHFHFQKLDARRRRLYSPFSADRYHQQTNRILGAHHTPSRITPPRLDRCLALTLEQSLTGSPPRVRARRGYSAIKTKPTAKPSLVVAGRRPASPRFDTYSLVILASYPDTVRLQTEMTSRLRPRARRRLLQRNGR